MSEFEKQIHDMFDHIWDCDINHPVFDDTVGELMSAVIMAYKNLSAKELECKKGKWIVTSEFDDCCYAKCNQCNVTQIFYYGKPLTNYCPNCGSYNGGEQE